MKKEEFCLTNRSIAKKYGVKDHIISNLMNKLRPYITEMVKVNIKRHHYSKNVLPIVEEFLIIYKHNTFSDAISLIIEHVKKQKELKTNPPVTEPVSEIKNYITLKKLVLLSMGDTKLKPIEVENLIYKYPVKTLKERFTISGFNYVLYHKSLIPIYKEFVKLLNNDTKNSDEAFKKLNPITSPVHKLQIVTHIDISKTLNMGVHKLKEVIESNPEFDHYRISVYTISSDLHSDKTVYLYDKKIIPLIKAYMLDNNAINQVDDLLNDVVPEEHKTTKRDLESLQHTNRLNKLIKIREEEILTLKKDNNIKDELLKQYTSIGTPEEITDTISDAETTLQSYLKIGTLPELKSKDIEISNLKNKIRMLTNELTGLKKKPLVGLISKIF